MRAALILVIRCGHDSVCGIDQIIEIFKSEEQWLPKKRRRLSLETTPPTSAKDADVSAP